MRTGTGRAYSIITFLALALFTAGALFKSEPLLLSFFLILMAAPVFFHGREVRIQEEKIVLEWGLLFKRRVEILPTEVVDVIDAPSTRYLILAKYTPEILLVPIGMIVGGAAIFSTTQYGWVGLGWMFIGTIELVAYTVPERKRAALIMTFTTILFSLLAGISKTSLMAPFLVAGVLAAALVWKAGAMIMNTIFLVTEREVYLLRYESKDEVKSLLSVMGGGNEAH